MKIVDKILTWYRNLSGWYDLGICIVAILCFLGMYFSVVLTGDGLVATGLFLILIGIFVLYAIITILMLIFYGWQLVKPYVDRLQNRRS